MNLQDFSMEFENLMQREFCRSLDSFKSMDTLRTFMDLEYDLAESYVNEDTRLGSAELMKHDRIMSFYTMYQRDELAFKRFEGDRV